MILQEGDVSTDVKHMQEYLTHLGYETKGVDGVFGNNTKKAVSKYGDEVLRYSTQYGRALYAINEFTAYSITLDYYEDKLSEDILSVCPWLEPAFEMYLDQEIKGEQHNPEILKLAKDSYCNWVNNDETPWCALAVSAWLERAEIHSMRSAWARDYLNFGEKLIEPRFGCIVVFERGEGGHVALVTGISEDGTQIRCLGGNQGDMVNERNFPVERVLGYRQPFGYSLPPVPVVGKTEVSVNEA